MNTDSLRAAIERAIQSADTAAAQLAPHGPMIDVPLWTIPVVVVVAVAAVTGLVMLVSWAVRGAP